MEQSGADADRPVLPWRLVVGVALHVVVPAYLIALGAAWLVAGPVAGSGRASGEGLLAFAGGVSWRFCLGYVALTLAAAGIAWALDPALRRRQRWREAHDPAAAAQASVRHLARAIAQAGRIGGVPLTAAAARVRTARWDHPDERCQRIAADLARAVDAFAAAHASASPVRRAEIAALAAASLQQVASAVEQLADERAQLDEGDALTHAAYLSHRYAVSTLDPAGPDRD